MKIKKVDNNIALKNIEYLKKHPGITVGEIKNATYEQALQKLIDDGIINPDSSPVEELDFSEVETINNIDTSNTNYQKYELSNYELKSIASLCEQEQGTAKGAAAEASLMANRFELYGSEYDNIYDYVRNSKWFAHASEYMDDNEYVDDSVLEAVDKVLTEGKRTLPKYIDEHDCISDIKSAHNDGEYINAENREDYISNVTKINNVYGSTFTFYTFADENGDPFGYTEEALRRVNQE